MHDVGRISLGGCRMSPKKKEQLESLWEKKELLIIDEDSMITRSFLARFAKNVEIRQSGHPNNDKPFGGINMIMCGDFHQLPPVAARKTAPLFYRGEAGKDSDEDMSG